MTKLLTYAICAFTALSVLAAPVDFGDIAADYPLYDSSDPFAIGVSMAAYTSATNANARLDALMLSNATTITNISTYVTAQHANRTDNPHGVTAAQAGAIANETDELALTALATNRVTRLFDSTGTRWIDGAGGVFSVSSGAWTNTYMDLTFSDDFATADGHAPAQRVHRFNDSQSNFRYLACGGEHAVNVAGVKWTIEVSGSWGYGIVTLKHYGETGGVDFTTTCDTRNVQGDRIRPAYFRTPWGSNTPSTGTIKFDNVYDPVTNALPRVAFLDDVPSTSGLLSTTGDGSQLTDMTVSQIAGAYPSANPSNFVTAASIPGPGCTDLGTNAVTITGATVSYGAQPTAAYTISVSPTAPRYCYALEIISTNAYTLGAGLNLRGTWTQTATNIVTFVPCTGTLWRVYGRGL